MFANMFQRQQQPGMFGQQGPTFGDRFMGAAPWLMAAMAPTQDAQTQLMAGALGNMGQMREQGRERQEKRQRENSTKRWLMDKRGLSAEDADAALLNPEILNHYLQPLDTLKPTDDMREWDWAQGDPAKLEFLKRGGTNIQIGDGMKLTEAQSKDVGFYSRGIYANDDLAPVEQTLTSMPEHLAGQAGSWGNYVKSPEYQQAERAGREFLAVILRKDTGAAITKEEFEMYGPMYLPQPGDDPNTIAMKREARTRALEAIRLGLGTARPLAEDIDAEFTARPKTQQRVRRYNPQTGQIE